MPNLDAALIRNTTLWRSVKATKRQHTSVGLVTSWCEQRQNASFVGVRLHTTMSGPKRNEQFLNADKALGQTRFVEITKCFNFLQLFQLEYVKKTPGIRFHLWRRHDEKLHGAQRASGTECNKYLKWSLKSHWRVQFTRWHWLPLWIS